MAENQERDAEKSLCEDVVPQTLSADSSSTQVQQQHAELKACLLQTNNTGDVLNVCL